MSKELVPNDPHFHDSAIVLRDNTFGITAGDGTTVEKVGRLLALIPMALDVVSEARSTIERLNKENEQLRERLEKEEKCTSIQQ